MVAISFLFMSPTMIPNAARPDFIDMSLNASSSSIEPETVNEANNGDENDGEGDSGDEDNTDTTDEGVEEDVSPGIPPIG